MTVLGRLGMPVFWLILCAIILVPCARFLLLAVSPRLFDQGAPAPSRWSLLQSLADAQAPVPLPAH